jgi:hypothetical protein
LIERANHRIYTANLTVCHSFASEGKLVAHRSIYRARDSRTCDRQGPPAAAGDCEPRTACLSGSLWQCDIPSRYLWRLIVVSLLTLFLPFCPPATAADPARILIISAWDDTMPAAVRATTAIRKGLAESSLKNAEIYYDTLDLSRFPGRAHEERMTRLL